MVTAKDSLGNNISVGGDMFYIRFSNECSITSQVSWSQVIGAANVLASPIEALMTDNGNGTYTNLFILRNFIYNFSYVYKLTEMSINHVFVV